MRSKRRQHVRRLGLRVAGPGFYLWDADAREALRLAAELSQHRAPIPVRQRQGVQRPDPVA